MNELGRLSQGVIFALGVAALGALGIVSWFILRPQYSPAQEIADCFSVQDAIPCIRPIVHDLVRSETGAQVVDSVKGSLSPLQCHYVGHVTGQEIYDFYGDIEVALASCDYACDSACLHGVVAQTIMTNLGISGAASTTELAHISAASLISEGRSLCKSAEACHAVGHIFFQSYQDIPSAFSACKEIGKSINCLNGVVMEYSDKLAKTSMLGSDLSFPDPDDFGTMCVFADVAEMSACFRYLPRIIQSTLVFSSQREAFAATARICDSYPKGSDTRIACYMGLPIPWSYFVITATPRALALCSSVTSGQDRAACVMGITSVATEERRRSLISFCGGLKESSLQSLCYQSVFYYLQSASSAKSLCEADPVCIAGASEYMKDPRDTLKSL